MAVFVRPSANQAIFPQQRKLMESSAQKSSGVHWCRQGSEQRSEGSGEGLGNLWCTARPGQVQWVQQGFQRLALQRFRQICENRILRLLGIPPKLILKEMEVLGPDT